MFEFIPLCLEATLPLLPAGVTDVFTEFRGLLPQTCLVFRLPDALPEALSYHASSSLARSMDDLLDEARLDPRLEHLDEDSLYAVFPRPALVGGLGGRRMFSVELVLERGSFPRLR